MFCQNCGHDCSPASDICGHIPCCSACVSTSHAECPDSLKKTSLRDVEYFMREGRISIAVARAYVDIWNATPGRFTFAEVVGPHFAPRIVQHDRCGDCGEIRRDHGKDHRFVA